MELKDRPRRLRGNAVLRKMVRETRVDKSALVYPMFVMEGENKAIPPNSTTPYEPMGTISIQVTTFHSLTPIGL